MRAQFSLAFLLALVTASPALGQVRIVGRVIDDVTELPISQVRVSIRAPDGSTLYSAETDSNGTFEFGVRRARSVRIHALRMSYQENTTPLLYFDNKMFFQVEVRLDPEAILLAPLEVMAWSELPENALHSGYQRRLQSGLGVYITREDVEKRNPTLVTDLLREVPGLQVSGEGSGTRPVVRVGRSGNRDCITQIFVDGFLLNRRALGARGNRPIDFRIDDAVFPATVEGIEIYRGLGTVPAEFLNPDAVCGVIAIWTRRGGTPD